DHLLAAEGSDWFWWFGEPFHSAEDAIFDRLFRSHLKGVYAAIGDPIPDELTHPIAPTGHTHSQLNPEAFSAPFSLIQARLGLITPPFYEWHGSGHYQVPRGVAMAGSPLVETIHFGFDKTTLYLRLEVTEEAVPRLDTLELHVDIMSGTRLVRAQAQLQA